MNRNLVMIIAIVVAVFIVALGANYFFGVDDTPQSANVSGAPETSAPPANEQEGTTAATQSSPPTLDEYGQPN
jgi:hypothetical protein